MTETLREIIEQAKSRYPIGTKYIPPHLFKDKAAICTIYNQDFKEVGTNSIGIGSGNRAMNGHNYSELVWTLENGWAEIIHDSESYQIF